MNATAAKLRRLIEHPNTPEGERAAAEAALQRIQPEPARASCKGDGARAAVVWTFTPKTESNAETKR